MRPAHARLLALLAAVALAGAACSASTNSYDAAKVEKFLAASQKGKTGGLPIGKTTCPEDVKLEEGVTFTCTIVIGGAAAPYKVTLTDVDGDTVNVKGAPTKAIIATAAAAKFVQGQLPAEASGATVTCGSAKVVLVDPGKTITCTLTLGSQSQDVTLLVKDTKGTVTIAS